jgi:flagellar hook protein FlgE
MMRGMFSAISGLKVHQTMLDVTANNLANVNTVGFKSSRTTFKDSLTQLYRSGAASSSGQGGANAAQVGLGVALGSIDNLMTTGSMQSTGNPLDVTIQGDGWFRVVNGSPTAGNVLSAGTTNGPVNYTRAGNFTRNDAGYLVTQEGYYVKGSTKPLPDATAADCYINIPAGATDVAIGQDGSVSFVPPATGWTQDPALPPVSANGRATAGYVSLAKFSNEAGLERASGNRWTGTGASGTETEGTPGGGFGFTTAGAIEMSNVDLATEFTTMITAQRGFQANSRVISTADEMLQDLVNLKH